MKARLLTLLLLTCGATFARSHFSIGVGVGYGPSYGYYAPAPVYAYYAPPPPRVVYYRPPYPGPAYSWVDGYWYPVRHRYYWRAGYWGRRPFAAARWVAPRYHRGYYYSGYWGR